MTRAGFRNVETEPRQQRRSYIKRLIWSGVVGAAVFSGFAAYAYLATATYRTAAVVRVEVPVGSGRYLRPPVESSQRLRDAVIEGGALTAMAADQGIDTPDGRLEFAQRIRDGVSIESADGKNFRITCEAPSAKQAQSLCEGLARAAVPVLPETATHETAATENQERKEKLAELLAFVTEHPEVSQRSSSDPKEERASQPAQHDDALLRALESERSSAQGQLEKLKAIDPSNPYADGLDEEIAAAHRRVYELDRTIRNRRAALTGTLKKKKEQEKDSDASSELNKKLAEILHGLAELPSKPEAPTKATAKVVTHAPLAASPVRPDRALILELGGLATLGVLLAGFGTALAAKRPRFVLRPRSLIEEAQTPPARDEERRAAKPEPAQPGRTPMLLVAPDDKEPATPPLNPLVEGSNSKPDVPLLPPAEGPRTLAGPGNTETFTPVPQERTPSNPEQPKKRSSGPISVKQLVAVEESSDVGESDAPAPRTAYTPPQRNITRRLGSPIWATESAEHFCAANQLDPIQLCEQPASASHRGGGEGGESAECHPAARGH